MDWFEDESFWQKLYPFMFATERFAMAAEQVDQILALTGTREGAVLDLCCGPARHSVEFARRGFAVTGVDRSPFLLERARERCIESGIELELVQDDMRTFRRAGAFDLAVNLFTSFGYFKDENDDLRVLRNICDSLKPGGLFVMDVMSKERIAKLWKDVMIADLPGGGRIVQRPEVLDDWTRIRNTWTVLQDGRYEDFVFEHFVYSGRELKDRLLASGFHSAHLYGDLQGNPYDLNASRLTVLARVND